MTPNIITAGANAIAKADGWTEREITARAMGPLQWQTYEMFARAAIEAYQQTSELLRPSQSVSQ